MKKISIHQARYKISDYRQFVIPQLNIKQGENWAFIGSNGSGKSILANILAGDLAPQSGEMVNSFFPIAHLSFEKLQKMVDDEWKKNNSDLHDDNDPDNDFGIKTAELIQSEINDNARCQQLAEQFGISHLLTRRFKNLSTGETRKALLCQALMASPELLILDEPFDGLDVDSRAQLALLLSTLAAQGVTIVSVLNRFNEIPAFIDYVGVLIDCNIAQIGEKHQLLEDESIKQLSALEQLNHIHLPAPEEEPIKLDDNQPRIILNHGHVYYNDRAVLDDLTWQVNAKEHWQIVGPNGAGKSTLLSLVTGDHPQGYSNDLTLFGRKRGSGETIWDIKKHIGYVSSSLHLDYRVSSTVKNVIISGYFDSIGVYQTSSDKQNKLADEWLALLNLTSQANAPFQSLSWGQQRLVLIVRALVKYPTLLILDEPLQGLDQLNRELVKRWIDLLIKSGYSQLLFVSHHAEDAPNCITNRLTFVRQAENSYQYHIEKLAH